MQPTLPAVKVDKIQRNFPKNKDDDGSFFRQMPFGPDFPTNPRARRVYISNVRDAFLSALTVNQFYAEVQIAAAGCVTRK